MATSTASFSVFPPPQVPRIAMPNPHNRKPSLSKDIVSHKESVNAGLAEHPVPKIPAAHLRQTGLSASPPPPPPPPGGIKALTGSTPSQSIKNSPQVNYNHTSNETTLRQKPSPKQGSIGSTSTLVRSTTPDGRSKSPVIPIRSMFPVYNPSLPLAGQNYYPQRPAAIHAPVPTSKYSRQDLRTYMSAPIDYEVGARTAPTSVADIPLEAINSREARFSSPRALERLWEATHGTEPNTTIGSFDLEMARTSEATFTFGSSPTSPFYSITTYDTNEIAIQKISPRKRNLICDVLLSSIEPIERRTVPGDGMVSFLFPKMAAMLAISQSNALADEYALASTHRDEVQAAAMKRAANQEASHLRYNHAERRYELEHPAIARRPNHPDFVTSPLLSQESNSVLHITVNQTAGQTSHGKPSIIVTNPAADRTPSDIDAAAAAIRLSTMGQLEADCPLASLDFHSNTLHIEASRILELMPSLFAIDSIVSAIVTVAIADHSTNVVMGNMDVWQPPPKDLRSPSGSAAMSWGTASVFYATIAEREEAEREAKIQQQTHKRDLKASKRQSDKSNRSWFGKPKVPSEKQQKKAKKGAKKTKQIVIDEFDLEKLGHFQSGSREGQELPAVTRTLLSLLVGGLKLIVWILTILVQMIAWILVHATRCFTSERF